jgi:hypothetical protein
VFAQVKTRNCNHRSLFLWLVALAKRHTCLSKQDRVTFL